MAIWNERVEEQFISMIEEKPALYDITEKSYTNRFVKADLWHQIESKLQISEKELRKKWDSLRTMYTRFYKLPPSGSAGAYRTPRQQWILSRLHFLKPHTKIRKSTLNLNRQESPATDQGSSFTSEATLSSDEEASSPSGATKFPPEPQARSTVVCEPAPSRRRVFGLRRAVAKRRRAEEQKNSPALTNLIVSTTKLLDHMSQQKERDTLDYYFKYIKSTVRDFPDHLQHEFLHDLDNLMYKYKCTLLKADTHVSLL